VIYSINFSRRRVFTQPRPKAELELNLHLKTLRRKGTDSTVN
jgi:hypothetical protein